MDSAVLEYQSVLFDDNLYLHADDLHLDLVCLFLYFGGASLSLSLRTVTRTSLYQHEYMTRRLEFEYTATLSGQPSPLS